jgi:hypothetical protein
VGSGQWWTVVLAQAVPMHTPVRFIIYPWTATVTQG